MSDDLRALLDTLPGRRVLVVGDVMLDVYLFGSASRICPEAPVPLIEHQRTAHSPGGAANTAANVAALQAEVHLVGVVGEDEAAAQLRLALEQRGVPTHGLAVDASRPTTTKTRLMAHHQQVARIDREECRPLEPDMEAHLLRQIEEGLEWAEVCVLSDYAKGAVSASLARSLIARARCLGKPVVVDPKGNDFSRYSGCTLLKPNLHEAYLFLRREVRTQEDVLDAGTRLLSVCGAQGVLLTRGAEGMSLFQPGSEPLHVPALAREVFDVTGAGDTVAATVAVALAAGASLEQSARLASAAAAMTVARLGTTCVGLDELAERLSADAGSAAQAAARDEPEDAQEPPISLTLSSSLDSIAPWPVGLTIDATTGLIRPVAFLDPRTGKPLAPQRQPGLLRGGDGTALAGLCSVSDLPADPGTPPGSNAH